MGTNISKSKEEPVEEVPGVWLLVSKNGSIPWGQWHTAAATLGMGKNISKSKEEPVEEVPHSRLSQGVWLLASKNGSIPFGQWHTAAAINGKLYELRGGKKDSPKASFGNDGEGDYRIQGSIADFFQPCTDVGGAMQEASGIVHYAMWQAATHSIKSGHDVRQAAKWFTTKYPIYSGHDCNCHKLAISLLNFACGGLDKETHGFLDHGCLHIQQHYHESNANWIVPYNMLPEDREHVFLTCTIGCTLLGVDGEVEVDREDL